MVDKQQIAIELTKKLADEGKLIEAGFAAMQVLMLQNASAAQVRDMRIAYMAGAEHLFRSITAVMDPGLEETERDMRRMTLINDELERWRGLLASHLGHGGGRG